MLQTWESYDPSIKTGTDYWEEILSRGTIGLLGTQQSQESSPLSLLQNPLREILWETWILRHFRRYFQHRLTGNLIPFAPHHQDFWDWVWTIESGVRPRPRIEILPRGGGKSTEAEMSCVALGARRVRKYGLYLCANQDNADKHLENIADLLESPEIAQSDPDLAERRISKFGHSRGWRRNRLTTKSGLTLDAFGLDVPVRGLKRENIRFDFMVIDDIDKRTDSALATRKKEDILKYDVIPAGAPDVAIIFIQNLIHKNSVIARLADGKADYLQTRQVFGPCPALRDLKYEKREVEGTTRFFLTAGTPIWEGQGLKECQDLVDDMGFSAFMAECQQEREYLSGAMYTDVWHDSIHMMAPFPIPATWRVWRAHDWGSSRPFATLWLAESNGEEILLDGEKRWWPNGTVFVIAEDYGWNGTSNEGLRLHNTEIAQRVKNTETELHKHLVPGKINPGPADSQIFTTANGIGKSIADDMETVGITWLPSEKGPGSRVTGWKIIYDKLQAATEFPMEKPGLFFFSTCLQCKRTIPELPKNPLNHDDVDTECEDHIGDALRYGLTSKEVKIKPAIITQYRT